ncbi:hypothetical protein AGMMS49944_29600 [Spirochaetia bacterium]|nr:hypothetical protein AGMMS49944_29600 [Spirochaetia bacterium]
MELGKLLEGLKNSDDILFAVNNVYKVLQSIQKLYGKLFIGIGLVNVNESIDINEVDQTNNTGYQLNDIDRELYNLFINGEDNLKSAIEIFKSFVLYRNENINNITQKSRDEIEMKINALNAISPSLESFKKEVNNLNKNRSYKTGKTATYQIFDLCKSAFSALQEMIVQFNADQEHISNPLKKLPTINLKVFN